MPNLRCMFLCKILFLKTINLLHPTVCLIIVGFIFSYSYYCISNMYHKFFVFCLVLKSEIYLSLDISLNFEINRGIYTSKTGDILVYYYCITKKNNPPWTSVLDFFNSTFLLLIQIQYTYPFKFKLKITYNDTT